MEDELDRLLEEFSKVLEWLAETKETVRVSDLTRTTVKTIEHYFTIMKKENPMLRDIVEKTEIALTTSLVFNIATYTSKGEDVQAIMESFTNGTIVYERPTKKPN